MLGDYLLTIDSRIELPRDQHGQYVPFERRWSVADILEGMNPELQMLADFTACQEAAMEFSVAFMAAKRE